MEKTCFIFITRASLWLKILQSLWVCISTLQKLQCSYKNKNAVIAYQNKLLLLTTAMLLSPSTQTIWHFFNSIVSYMTNPNKPLKPNELNIYFKNLLQEKKEICSIQLNSLIFNSYRSFHNGKNLAVAILRRTSLFICRISY